MELYLLDCENLQIDAFLDYLSPNRKNKIAKLPPEKKRSVTGPDLLLQYVFGCVDYHYDKDGHPILNGNNKYVSFSHSGRYALMGVSDVRLGVDIQEITEFNERVAKRFLNLGSSANRDDFFRTWVVMEANGKRMGKGILISRDELVETYIAKYKNYYLAATLGEGEEVDKFVVLNEKDLLASPNFK